MTDCLAAFCCGVVVTAAGTHDDGDLILQPLSVSVGLNKLPIVLRTRSASSLVISSTVSALNKLPMASGAALLELGHGDVEYFFPGAV